MKFFFQTSIFKNKRADATEKPKPIPSYINFDGMGGHEKNPTLSSKLPSLQGLKRAKPSSTITSSKFRKLSKPQINKIDSFTINLSDADTD